MELVPATICIAVYSDPRGGRNPETRKTEGKEVALSKLNVRGPCRMACGLCGRRQYCGGYESKIMSEPAVETPPSRPLRKSGDA